MQNLSVISVNIWQIIISIANLFILFLILKKFLYKPVRNFVAKRENEVEENLNAAKQAKANAQEQEKLWDEKMEAAKIEANETINAAADTAKKRSNEIIKEARQKADDIIQDAKSQAELEHKKAESEIKEQIVVLSNELTEKLLNREINLDDNKELIDSFLEQVGNSNG